MSDNNQSYPFADEGAKEAIELGLKFFEASMAENQRLGEWLMKTKDEHIAELERDNGLLCDYVYYVEKCVKLMVVPRTFDFWHDFIHNKVDYFG